MIRFFPRNLSITYVNLKTMGAEQYPKKCVSNMCLIENKNSQTQCFCMFPYFQVPFWAQFLVQFSHLLCAKHPTFLLLFLEEKLSVCKQQIFIDICGSIKPKILIKSLAKGAIVGPNIQEIEPWREQIRRLFVKGLRKKLPDTVLDL